MVHQNDKPESLRWLITGGCGFIGTALIRQIISKRDNDQICVLDNLSVGTKQDLSKVCDYIELDLTIPHSNLKSFNDKSKASLIVGDIKDPQTCQLACENIDVVVHFAANTGVGPSVENPRFDMMSNVVGTFNMLDAAKKTM